MPRFYCEYCKEPYRVPPSRAKTTRFCSRACRAIGINTPEVIAKKTHRGEKHPRFVPIGTRRQWPHVGKRIAPITVKTENGWELEHRVVTQAPSGLVVHHKDGDPTNNVPDNLETITQSEHAALHTLERARDALGRLT